MKYEEIELIEKSAELNLQEISKIVLGGLKPPAGAYAFFNHNAHALERLQDCLRILKRLYGGRYALNILSRKQNKVMPKDWPAGVPYPDEVQEIFRQEGEVNSLMKQDLETLYIWGIILLDQISLEAIHIANLNIDKKHPFISLVGFFEAGNKSALDPIWIKFKSEVLWLRYHFNFYRNKFIVHSNRPWQRGTTRSMIGNDFNLHIPTPPGWDDDKYLDQEIKKLIHLAPEYIKNARNDYWEKSRPGALIERIFDNIGNIPNKTDRDRVNELFGRKGGSTPSFQIIGFKIVDSVNKLTSELIEITKNNLNLIDLGKPHMTSDEMWKERNDIV